MLHSVRPILVQLVLVLFLAVPAMAEVRLPEPQESRAQALFAELRCVVCQNQSIGGSDADVARDLREIVREQIVAGQSNSEIRTFLVERYGEYILLKPVFAWHTALLWGAPFLLLIAGAGLLFARGRRTADASATALTADEEVRIAGLLKDED